MSGASSWLQKMRKGELVELSDTVGFTEYDGLKKTELEVALDDYLTKNASQFSSDTQLAPFYKGRNGSSPVKKEAASLASDIETKVKSVKRRVTKAAEELLATDDSEIEPATTRARSALTRTPRASALSNLSFASNVPLPPSPSVVADVIDRRTQVLRSKVANMYEDSGLIEYAQTTRESLSTVQAVQAVVTLFEFYNLRKEVLADRYAFTIPTINYLTSAPYDVKIPDLFLLLTASFWNPVSLWAITTLVIPLIASYFFNLTAKPSRTRSHAPHFAYKFDPLTFSIAKALMTFVVFGQDVNFGGLVDLESVARINSAVYGGWKGVLVGTGITGLITLYDAVLKK
ncbi:hypothetical protein IFR04_013628 [Cadophora malorum]|uniref:Uncharacterized protein n=1 Tax=Cadophora malorum TaxID=108018 RepID=A0A8H7T134_9HELO|nr:hypothetical protein IFR04_013628 [Cadophora malorum]